MLWRQSRKAGKTMKQFLHWSCMALVLMAALVPVPVSAVEPGEMLDDPVLEARAREVSANLRCLVCQNQSIDDSDAELAKDLRILVREFISKGLSNEETTNEIVNRFGEYVLLKPRVAVHTLFLWYGPFALLLFAIGYIYWNWSGQSARQDKRSGKAKATALSPEEQKKIEQLMKSD